MALAARIARASLAVGVLAFAGCASSPPHHYGQVALPQLPSSPPPREGGTYKIGAPYQVDGVWYYPAENYAYREEGVASWYGPDFQGKHTANGERFDMNSISAAHPTLPMPSSVHVTNLDNGRELDVRVNDRGPFKSQRVIDLSRRAAQLLGFDLAGTAHVRVEINAEESLRLKNEALRANPGELPQVAAAPRETVTSVALAPPPSRPTAVVAAAATAVPASSSASAPIAAPVIVAPIVPPAAPSAIASSPQAAPNTVVAVADPPAAPPPSATAAPPAAPLSHAVVDDPPPQAAQIRKTPKIAKAAKPQTPPRATGPGFYVQAGAFADLANAHRLEQKLKELGNSFVLPVTLNNRQLYRVRLGPLADQALADALLGRVRAYGYDTAKIVRY